MSNQQHPITPPPELVGQWTALANEEEGCKVWSAIATQAAHWGADQELEACCELVPGLTNYLRAARRPKPPSLAKRALHILGTHGNLSCAEHDTIRRALEQLPN